VGGARPETEGEKKEEKIILKEVEEEEVKIVSLGGPGAPRSYYVTSPDTRSGTT